MTRHILCALDTGSLDEAVSITKKLSPHIGGFKVGHGLTLNHGLDVISRLQDAGAQRIFVDLKFHDIPNVVALAVREAGRRGAWMVTMHVTGGRAMMTAAAEEAAMFPAESRPILMGVAVLTSLDQTMLNEVGIPRPLDEQVLELGKLAMQSELDGMICSPHEVASLRTTLGHGAVLVTPGIKMPNLANNPDQQRSGDAKTALADGADYVVVGRALTSAPDPIAALDALLA